MSIQESVKICHVPAIVIAIRHASEVRIAIGSTAITVAHVRIPVEGIFLPHEGVRVLPYLVANSRVVLEISFENRMILHKLSIVQQGRIFANLFGNFTMVIQEPIKTRHVSAIVIAIRHVSAVGIAIGSTGITIAQVRVAGVEIFQSHERVGALADLLFHTRVFLEIRTELRMAFEELRIVDQGRRFAKLVRDFAMTIEKLIKSRQVPASDVVVVLDRLPVLRGRRLRTRGRWDTQQRCRRCTENQSYFREPS
ncbi:MAG: hypothetical protein WB524_25515 [Acidobacteriaceae bacterium]